MAAPGVGGVGPGSPIVLKEGNLFAVLSPTAECGEEGALGLFWRDTRFLSTCRITFGDEGAPRVLGVTQVRPFTCRLVVTDRDGEVAAERELVVSGDALVERVRLTGYGLRRPGVRWRLAVGSDFRDMMALRGGLPMPGGTIEPARPVGTGRWVLSYRGVDGVDRHLVVGASGAPSVAPDGTGRLDLEWDVPVAPGETREIQWWARPVEGELDTATLAYEPGSCDALGQALESRYREWLAGMPAIRTGCEDLNRMLSRAQEDLRALVSDFGDGPFPAAGIPWFAVPFGRDSLWTAYFLLPYVPGLAGSVLRTLARYQATGSDPWTEAEPGKILHELRFGEAVRLGLIPHRPYYGSVDATPLFAALACDHAVATGALESFALVRPAVDRALEWMERFGDADGDGFIEYARRSAGGLDNQGWKDARDSVWHPDGRLADPPIALVEVQAYAYRAYAAFAEVLARLGESAAAGCWRAKAERLAEHFDEAYWMADAGYLAMALDGDKRPVRVIASNAGHALWAGSVHPSRARTVCERLAGPGLFSGWGIRTIGSGQARFNPMSYHNGSVWPHDTAIALAGMSRYGRVDLASRIARGLARASRFFEGARLPELFCGFSAGDGGPVPYPSACSPQAWAAATPFALVSALTGLSVDGAAGRVTVHDRIPPWLGEVSVEGLLVGNRGRLDLRIRPVRGPSGGEQDDVPVDAEVKLGGEAAVELTRSRALRG